jgi:hypothetical protein
MSAINEFLLQHGLRIRENPCISPDFCLDWGTLLADLQRGNGIQNHPLSRFRLQEGELELVENAFGDHAWVLGVGGSPDALEGGAALTDGRVAFPAAT